MAKSEQSESPKSAGKEPRGDGFSTLLDAATYNLNIAQEYIDEARYPAEYRLICFHYGVALMAQNKAELRASARRYFEAAVNWSVQGSDEIAVFHRIVGEAYYNLGVIDELEGLNDSALENYRRALEHAAQEAPRDGVDRFAGLKVLAGFGAISLKMKRLRAVRDSREERDWPTRDRPTRDVELWHEIDALLSLIGNCRGRGRVTRREKAVYVSSETKPPEEAQRQDADQRVIQGEDPRLKLIEETLRHMLAEV